MNETQAFYSVLSLPAAERPRERLLQHGADVLSSVELIAVLLGSGMKGMPILQLSQEIMSRFGSLQNLADATIEELCQIKGLGTAKAIQLKAALNLGKRLSRTQVSAKFQIRTPLHAYHLVKDDLEKAMQEHFLTILQDVKGYVICSPTVALGTLTATVVHPREVFYPAIRHRAASLILVHNHPSGDPTPSKEDLDVTKTLVAVGRLVGICVNDHIIIGRDRYVSLREEGFDFSRFPKT
ncbi:MULTISPECIES: RadC family protein [Parachlamydia]|jgi:DNA repair protein RadC|uniref:RadC family protein n=1 Tax=Parachlamydia TaxID=83551 RepID=UPI0001C17B78|nr:DNA repair protein RadC [Parachlamydia acanthamoebae]EFB42464.1 hypothetical protein pah_c008o090 [Parachlamydia acanthamoebae str. Hall's coccus]